MNSFEGLVLRGLHLILLLLIDARERQCGLEAPATREYTVKPWQEKHGRWLNDVDKLMEES